MTTAIAPAASTHPTAFEKHEPVVYESQNRSALPSSTNDDQTQAASHDVVATFNYHKNPADGSAPAPTYVGKPETYERPTESKEMTVRDIRGEEDRYSLETTGFQVFRHVSAEKEFIDEEKIKREYYPEIEEILKAA